MVEQHNYKCGHAGDVPTGMGRGMARVSRLQKYFGRLCPVCRKAAVAAFAAKLSKIIGRDAVTGKVITRLYNAEEIAAYVAKVVK